jgi:hypothetical protein
MYTLYRLGSISHEPDALWLTYTWDSFENREWRLCVRNFLNEVASHGHKVIEVPSPPFKPGEDFIEVEYLVAESRTIFTSDHLLSLITITSQDPSALRGVWNHIGNKMGWAN